MLEIRTIIVDDEEEAREGLKVLLNRHANYEILAVARDGIEAINCINTHRPDLVLLDIQMPQINGFEVLNSLKVHPLPAIIFVTAYDEFALKAFEHHALDYLLKPFSNKRLNQALEHACDQIARKNVQQKLEALLREINEGKSKERNHLIEEAELNHRLVIKSMGKIHLLETADIEWIEAYDYYIKIHTGKQYFLVRESMKRILSRLPQPRFQRIHKSAIVNMEYVKEVTPLVNGDYRMLLTHQKELRVSRHYKHCLETIVL